MQNVILTKEGYEKIKSEKEVLHKKREETVKSLTRAREMGDLSENALYKAAKMELASIDRRIRHTTYLLRHAKIIAATTYEKVSVGVIVTVTEGTKTRKFHLVGSYESDPLEGKISENSPLGKALIGRAIGEKVVVSTPRGELTYIIKNISLPSSASVNG